MSTTTIIDVTDQRLFLRTSEFGFNTLHRHPELHAELWQWHEAVASAISDHHAQVMGQFFPCPVPEPQVPPGDVESVFEPYRGEPWTNDLLGPLVGAPEGQHVPIVLPPPITPGPITQEGPAAPGPPPVRCVHPSMVCTDCGDRELVLSHEPGEEGWYRCDCGTLHQPHVNTIPFPDVLRQESPPRASGILPGACFSPWRDM